MEGQNPELTSGSEWSPTAALLSVVERTLAASSARIEVTSELHTSLAGDAARHVGGTEVPTLLRVVGALVKLAGKGLLKAAPEGFDPRHMTAEGFIEPSARRYAVHFGAYAIMYKDGRRWGGRSGRELSTLPPWPTEPIDALWMLDVLAGTTNVQVDGIETVRDKGCQRLSVLVDFQRASSSRPGGLLVPRVNRLDDLGALPMAVWTDGEYVRRAQFRQGSGRSEQVWTVELWDFGVRVDLDWSRLPQVRNGPGGR